MQAKQISLNPLDLLVLLKIAITKSNDWSQQSVAGDLGLSQSEISKSLNRSKFAGLIDPSGKNVMRSALLEFLQYGVKYAFPQQPGALTRGLPTAHSAEPLKKFIDSSENYVWPSGKGKIRGQAIIPLYPSVVEASLRNEQLHQVLALVDALRVGKARERELAIKELKSRIIPNEK